MTDNNEHLRAMRDRDDDNGVILDAFYNGSGWVDYGDVPTLRNIVSELADMDPSPDHDCCWFCGKDGAWVNVLADKPMWIIAHKGDCLWLRARQVRTEKQ